MSTKKLAYNGSSKILKGIVNAINDLIDSGGGGGGGSIVTVSPKILTGTNIADIAVDGQNYEIYAPTYSVPEGTAAILHTGTDTTQSLWTAKMLHDEFKGDYNESSYTNYNISNGSTATDYINPSTSTFGYKRVGNRVMFRYNLKYKSGVSPSDVDTWFRYLNMDYLDFNVADKYKPKLPNIVSVVDATQSLTGCVATVNTNGIINVNLPTFVSDTFIPDRWSNEGMSGGSIILGTYDIE
jgi:hypothetical protein